MLAEIYVNVLKIPIQTFQETITTAGLTSYTYSTRSYKEYFCTGLNNPDWLKIVQLTRKLKFTPTFPDLIERFHIIVFQPPKNCLIFFNLKLADLALRKGAESLMLKYQLVWPQTWPFHLTSPLRFNERVGPIPWNIFTCNYKHLAQIYRIFPHFMWKFKV